MGWFKHLGESAKPWRPDGVYLSRDFDVEKIRETERVFGKILGSWKGGI